MTHALVSSTVRGELAKYLVLPGDRGSYLPACKAIRLLVIDPASSSSCFPQKNTLPFGGGVRLPQYSNTNAHISIHDSEFPLDFIVWLCHLYLLSQ